MTTETAECTFVVKEDGNGRTFVAVEPTIAGLNISLNLKEGATIDDAHPFARQMRSMIVSISLTLATEPYVPNIVEGPQTKQ